jgi:D-arabinose 1-dehydrogenase-like Zn-dependent alcohol dehydrogenase
MRAMILETPGQPLRLADLPVPVPSAGQVLLRVHACAVCRTDLHIVDGELASPKLPLVPGHQIVGTVVEMSDIPSFPYQILWGERVLKSVANLTRQDGEEFLALAPLVPVRTEVQPFPLSAANEALEALRAGKIQGAAVLVVDGESSGYPV